MLEGFPQLRAPDNSWQNQPPGIPQFQTGLQTSGTGLPGINNTFPVTAQYTGYFDQPTFQGTVEYVVEYPVPN